MRKIKKKWIKENKADNFGAYFVALLCPWNLETGKPEYLLNWKGFQQWRESKPSSFLLQYCQNCIDPVGTAGESYRLASHLLRNRSAHTKDYYEKEYKNNNIEENKNEEGRDEDAEIQERRKHTGVIPMDEELQTTIKSLQDRYQLTCLEAAGKGNKISKQSVRDEETVKSLSSLFESSIHNGVPLRPYPSSE